MKIDGLKEIGLSNGEIEVYSAVLNLGISNLNKIQEKTGIERRNIYDVLNKLIEKGLVSYTIEKGKRTYQCTHPDKLLEEIKKKENSLKELENQIPDIKTLFSAKKPGIRAEVFRGNESIKALMDEMLEYKETYWIGGNSGIEKTSLNFWFKHWMTRRIEGKRWLYDLSDYGTSLENIKSSKKDYYEKQWLPKNLSSPMNVAIFGDKVAQILWSDQSFAFVLESKEIKESFMKYFEYFWKKK